ncbi:MAG TPA: PTS sugar transporter subunit IIA [Planctomycetota bacterium]|nr:PTS sugar transporter subunit IIA [Planctomycetota bacterium]
MKVSSLLNPKLIKCGLVARTKDEALLELLEVMAAGTPEVTLDELKAALAEREKLGPFSMAKGSAFPHARTEKVSDFRIAIGTLPRGLDFKAPDGNFIRLVVLFVIPKKHSNLYLTTLAQFLNLFATEENLLKAANSKTGEELIAAVDSISPRPPAPPAPSTSMATVTPSTMLSKAIELLSSSRGEAVPVVDADGNLVGELSAGALLQLGVREHFLQLASAASLQAGASIESVFRSHGDATLEKLGVISSNGYRTMQEDEPLLETVVKLSQSGARGAYVLRGRRLVGHVSTADILKKISGSR